MNDDGRDDGPLDILGRAGGGGAVEFQSSV